MKLIELFRLMLEKKAPKKIKFLGMIMNFIETAEWGDYIEVNSNHKLSDCRVIDCLNENIEIIEDKPKKINTLSIVEGNEAKLSLKAQGIINELIEQVNYLREKSDKE